MAVRQKHNFNSNSEIPIRIPFPISTLIWGKMQWKISAPQAGWEKQRCRCCGAVDATTIALDIDMRQIWQQLNCAYAASARRSLTNFNSLALKLQWRRRRQVGVASSRFLFLLQNLVGTGLVMRQCRLPAYPAFPALPYPASAPASAPAPASYCPAGHLALETCVRPAIISVSCDTTNPTWTHCPAAQVFARRGSNIIHSNNRNSSNNNNNNDYSETAPF